MKRKWKGKGKKEERRGREGNKKGEGKGRVEGRVWEKCVPQNSSCSVNNYPRKFKFIGNRIYWLIAHQKFAYNSLVWKANTFPTVTMVQDEARFPG